MRHDFEVVLDIASLINSLRVYIYFIAWACPHVLSFCSFLARSDFPKETETEGDTYYVIRWIMTSHFTYNQALVYTLYHKAGYFAYY